MKVLMTNKRCVLFVCLTSTRWWRVYIRVFLYVCVYACLEIFFFCAFKQRGEDAAVAAQRRPSRSRLFFWYIYIFRKKKNEKRLLLMLRRRRRLLLLLSFFQCITTMPRFFLASTLLFSRSPSIDPASFSFAFLFFLSLFFLSTPFHLSLTLSPWVMSNLRVLCI